MKTFIKFFKQHRVIWVPVLILILFSCKASQSPAPPIDTSLYNRIVILYTNDEHGWMEPSGQYGGAAGMMGLWKENEAYTADGPFLILSGGDMWTGPAISTWTQGESMTAVMSAMEYDAAAIGNHEFDFRIDGLVQRISESAFPLLAANIREKNTGEIPPFAVPYIIKEVNGVKVGLIGLSSESTPLTTFPDFVEDLEFINYVDALEETVPQVKGEGAQLLVVLGHICHSEMLTLAPYAAELGIALVGGGHCNQLITDDPEGVTYVQTNGHMMYYARVDIYFDTGTETVMSINASVHENSGGAPDPAIESIVSFWRSEVDKDLSQVIGYVENKIPRNSTAMSNMITDSWLWNDPTADISLTNSGGIRQDIPAGDITYGTLVSVLPFENNLYRLALTGEQLTGCIQDLVMGGMTAVGGYQLMDGTPIDPGASYTVLTINYLYSRWDYNFSLYDPDPYDTSIHYRQPVIDWIKSLNTTMANPLDGYLDHTSRR